MVDSTEEKSSTLKVWNVVGAERTSRHNVTENSTAVLSSGALKLELSNYTTLEKNVNQF
jgi:hypothetical protein